MEGEELEKEDVRPCKQDKKLGLCPAGDGKSLQYFKQDSEMIKSQHDEERETQRENGGEKRQQMCLKAYYSVFHWNLNIPRSVVME